MQRITGSRTLLNTSLPPGLMRCRFAYATGPWMGAAHRREHAKAKLAVAEQTPPPRSASLQPVQQWPYEDDAFGTIMQVCVGDMEGGRVGREGRRGGE